jgi:hypothetical protein
MIRVAVALGSAAAVLCAIVLAYAAAKAAPLDPGSATILAIGAVWLTQTLFAIGRRLDRPE